MATNIADIRNKVIPRLQDDVGKLSVTPAMTCDVDKAILSAVEKYSKDRPRERASRVAGLGTFKYALTGGSAILPGFIDGFSHVVEVAYPHVLTEQIPAWLEKDQFGEVRDHLGLWLWFGATSPLASEFFLALYTAKHTLDVASSTVPESDDEALADLGAAEAHEMLAAFYAKSTDSSMQADVVNHVSKAGEHRSMARQYRDRYAEKMGGAGAATGPAFAIGDADGAFGNEARDDRFFHGRVRF